MKNDSILLCARSLICILQKHKIADKIASVNQSLSSTTLQQQAGKQFIFCDFQVKIVFEKPALYIAKLLKNKV
jgi:hypothetical protein